jgi:hypothetical protein
MKTIVNCPLGYSLNIAKCGIDCPLTECREETVNPTDCLIKWASASSCTYRDTGVDLLSTYKLKRIASTSLQLIETSSAKHYITESENDLPPSAAISKFARLSSMSTKIKRIRIEKNDGVYSVTSMMKPCNPFSTYRMHITDVIKDEFSIDQSAEYDYPVDTSFFISYMQGNIGSLSAVLSTNVFTGENINITNGLITFDYYTRRPVFLLIDLAAKTVLEWNTGGVITFVCPALDKMTYLCISTDSSLLQIVDREIDLMFIKDHPKELSVMNWVGTVGGNFSFTYPTITSTYSESDNFYSVSCSGASTLTCSSYIDHKLNDTFLCNGIDVELSTEKGFILVECGAALLVLEPPLDTERILSTANHFVDGESNAISTTYTSFLNVLFITFIFLSSVFLIIVLYYIYVMMCKDVKSISVRDSKWFLSRLIASALLNREGVKSGLLFKRYNILFFRWLEVDNHFDKVQIDMADSAEQLGKEEL